MGLEKGIYRRNGERKANKRDGNWERKKIINRRNWNRKTKYRR